MRTRFTLLSLLLLTSACGDDDGGASSTTGASETGDTTGSEPATGSTGGEPTTSDDTSTGEPTTSDATTGEPTTSTTEPTEPTTGEMPDGVPGCQALCDAKIACDITDRASDCLEFCNEDYLAKTQLCADASATFLACVTALECDQLFDAEWGQSEVCIAERQEMNQVCGKHDFCGVGWGGGLGECDLEIMCDDEPLRKMTCDDETCTCLVDGEQTGSCAADGVCDDTDALKEKGWTCCQF